MSDLRWQYARALQDIGFVPAVPHGDKTVVGDRTVNRNSAVLGVVLACVCAGLYPNVIKVKYPLRKYKAMGEGVVLPVRRGRCCRCDWRAQRC